MGNLKFSKLNEMYDISKENMDFEPIYKAIDSVNNFFAIHKDEVILNQTTDYQMKQDHKKTTYIYHQKYGFGMIVDQKPEIVIIKFDNEKCGQKQIKKNHPSYQEISFNEYNNKKIESKTKEIIEINFPDKQVYAVGTVSSRFRFMGKLDKIDFVDISNSLLIVLDTPDAKRIDGANPQDYACSIKIDLLWKNLHH